MRENNSTTPHILNTSATLLGFCFIVFTSLKVSKLSQGSLIDEVTAVATVFFMASTIFSFLAMRNNTSRGLLYEKLADIIFLSGLFILFSIIMLITFNMI